MANHANHRATGPVTPEGKAISSQNARKHGFCSQTVLLPGESATEYQDLQDAYTAEFHPKRVIETRLVHEMVDAEWRLARIRRAEAEIFTRHESLADALEKAAGPLKLLQRYEVQFRRQYERSLETLRDLRRQESESAARAARQEDRAFRDTAREFFYAPMPGEEPELRNELPRASSRKGTSRNRLIP